VLIVILGGDQAPEDPFDKDPGSEPAQPGDSAQPEVAPAQPIVAPVAAVDSIHPPPVQAQR
jgi:hypothetical protein